MRMKQQSDWLKFHMENYPDHLQTQQQQQQGNSEEAMRFMKAFHDSNELIYSCCKTIKIIHHFVDELIKTKRQQLDMQLFRQLNKNLASKKHTTNPEIKNSILQSNNGSQPNQIATESEGHGPKNAPEKWRG
ncbi:hypothetical protein M9H77_07667 [Catharanthus roseus]|uniref:Uncharacterized protein n=1 Tax=Catharanthus roseus TaxID=4058 RepID=A0ACC0BVJ8_CATRO|nr:hypothetical protein M9H77_07667 [Catharanthus roseus]